MRCQSQPWIAPLAITSFSFCSRNSLIITLTVQKIDVPARSSKANGAQANAGSVWETQIEIVSDTDEALEGVWRVNSEASPYQHVAMWPQALVKQMILPTTEEEDIVLDPFGGSGTTAEVAYRMGRRAIIIESSPACVDALKDRISRLPERLF